MANFITPELFASKTRTAHETLTPVIFASRTRTAHQILTPVIFASYYEIETSEEEGCSDTLRTVQAVEHSAADTQRRVMAPESSAADTLRGVQSEERSIADAIRTVQAVEHSAADTRRCIADTEHGYADTLRQVYGLIVQDGYADTSRHVEADENGYADTLRQVQNHESGYADTLREVLGPQPDNAWLQFDQSATLDNFGRRWTATGSPTIAATNAKSGSALQLSGANYLSTEGNLDLGGEDFTVDGWAYLNSANMTLRRFLFEFYNPATNNILALYTNKTGTQLVLLLKINDTNDFYLASATPLKNQLFHFAVVYKKSTNKMTLYINGNVVYDTSAGRLQNTAPFTELNLGYARSHDAYWNGTVDEFRFLKGETLYTAAFAPPSVEKGYADTERDVANTVSQDGYADTLRVTGCAGDTLREITDSVSVTVDFDTERITAAGIVEDFDTERILTASLDLEFDTEREVRAQVNQLFDTEIKVPHQAVVSPVPPATPTPTPAPQENAGTIRSISVALNEQQITDDLSFEAVGSYNIMELIQGSYLDYQFSMRIEAMQTSGGITEASCCSDVDELLYTQLAYRVPENEQWHVVNPETQESESQQVASASTHITKIARVLGKTPVLQFADFISTAEVEPQGLTYANLISNIFGFTATIPQKMINCYIRGGNLYVIQRGHEQNTVDLTSAKITAPVIARELVRTTWGSDVWSKTETKTQKKFQGFDEELEFYPEENAERPNQNYTYDSDGLVSQSITIDETTDGKTKTQVDYHYTTSNGRKFLSMEETTVTYNYGTSKAYTETRKVFHTPLNNGQEHVHGIDEDGEPIGSNVGGKRWTDKPTPYQYYFSGWLKSITKTPQYKEIEMERTLYGISLVDTSFPVVGDSKLIELTNDLKWLNRKTKETITFDVYDYPHLIDFNDRIVLDGNTYFLQSNKATRNTSLTNKQSLTLVRWY